MLRPIPNVLSVSRIVLAVLFPLVPWEWQVWVVGIAAATDVLDGRLARAVGASDGIGKYLDPAGDKVFVAAVVITLVVQDLLRPADLILLWLRDVVVLVGGAVLIAAGRRAALAGLGATSLGKVTTLAQLIYLLLVVGRRDRFPEVLAVTAAVGALAAMDYLRRGWPALVERPAPAFECEPSSTTPGDVRCSRTV
ncbi:MAG TPA: CDP-alcohol phosphatidyltransferase family protein [Gemmataceae bacterium]|nr:CDP-alcohol phosphatidyltransferase family protein [Gemmataceae bacterium]